MQNRQEKDNNRGFKEGKAEQSKKGRKGLAVHDKTRDTDSHNQCHDNKRKKEKMMTRVQLEEEVLISNR